MTLTFISLSLPGLSFYRTKLVPKLHRHPVGPPLEVLLNPCTQGSCPLSGPPRVTPCQLNFYQWLRFRPDPTGSSRPSYFSDTFVLWVWTVYGLGFLVYSLGLLVYLFTFLLVFFHRSSSSVVLRGPTSASVLTLYGGSTLRLLVALYRQHKLLLLQ